MALTVINDPTKYNLSRNPHLVLISTDNAFEVTNNGVKSETGISVYFAAVNDTITFVKGGGSPVVFTFKATTNIGANELGITVGPETAAEYASRLVNDLMLHSLFATDYNGSAQGSKAILKAKTGGTNTNLTGSSTNVLDGVVSTYILGTDQIVNTHRPNYGIAVELFAESIAGANDFTHILTSIKTPSNNQAQFDLAEVIDANLAYDLPTSMNANTPFWARKVCKRFYVKVWEQYGNPAVTTGTSLSGMPVDSMDGNKFVSEKYFVLKGGFDKISWRLQPNDQFNSYHWFTSDGFLTRQPRTKKISAKQAEWVYFLFDVAPSTIAKVRYRLYTKDGLALEFSTLNTSSGIQPGHVWAFPLNRDTGYFTQGNGYIAMVTHIVQANGISEISDSFTYLLDEGVYPDETILFFTNSDGGLDTLRCTGVRETPIDFEREVPERTISANDEQHEGDALVLYAQKNNSFKVFSGWKTQEELLYAEEIMLTRVAFTYGNAYGQNVKVPIIITGKQLVVHRTNQNMKGYVIEYRDALVDEISQAATYPVV